MPSLRRALLFASAGRYLVMGINLAGTLVVARLLTPAEFGASVLGTSILGIAEAVRELGSIAYVVQQRDLTQDKLRAMFTISLIVSVAMTIVLIAISRPIAAFYGEPLLAYYIDVMALGYATAPFAHPIYALLSRALAFKIIAAIDVFAALLNTATSICLVRLGFGFVSLAWGGVIAGLAYTLTGFAVQRDFSVYRLSLKQWRSVLMFGAYGSATAFVYRSSESLFFLIIGKLLSAQQVGLCQRALLLATFPERVVLAGIGSVALPAFSLRAREGGDLRSAYLNVIEHLTAILWPLLILLSIFARPIVAFLLGPQWSGVAPLLQVFAAAFMLNFSTVLNYPLQVAAGAIRQTVPLACIQAVFSLSVLSIAAHFGIWAVAWSTLITIPCSVGLSLWFLRVHIRFTAGEFARALTKSALCAIMSAIGPILVVVFRGHADGLPLWLVAASVVWSAIGWLLGLWLTGHPLLKELCRGLGGAMQMLGATRWAIGSASK
jgi:O-antigen/teichoic acid export membrane protein